MTTPTEMMREAKALGVRVSVRDGVVTVESSFTPGDVDAYMMAEYNALSLLSMAPMTYPGTVWGTDSGSVGGHSGLTGGYMRMNKSGVSKRFANGLTKLLTRVDL